MRWHDHQQSSFGRCRSVLGKARYDRFGKQIEDTQIETKVGGSIDAEKADPKLLRPVY